MHRGIRPWIMGAIFVAMGLLLPVAFPLVGAMGSVFLPMHIPVLMAGLLLGPRLGFWVGLLTPSLSSLVTGMPPVFPTLAIMAPELAASGFLGGLLYRTWQMPLLLALIVALFCGRLVVGIDVWLLVQLVGLEASPWLFVSAATLKGLPGMAVQLIFIPLLVKRLEGWMN